MKITVRLAAICLCLTVVIGVFAGCGNNKPSKVFDPKNDPKLHIEYYEKLTSLYGTERMFTLDALGYELSGTTFEHWHHIKLPLEAQVGNMSFSVELSFEDWNDDRQECLQSVSYVKTYAYPDEKELAVQEILELCKHLEEKLGKPDEVDGWNDFWEEQAATELDQMIPVYKSEEQLMQMLDNDWSGEIMRWNMSGYATAALNEYRANRGWETEHYLSLNVQRMSEEIRVVIYF